MKKLILFLSIFMAFKLSAQNVGIGTNTPKDLSKLDIESNTSGFLLPRMNTAQRATLGGNVSALGATISVQYNGLMVFDTDNLTLYMWDSNKSDFANGGWNNVLDADASVNDADADPNNEIQSLSQSGTNVTLSNGGGTVSVADNDNNSSNELQTISKSGSTVSLSNGGGSFTDDNTTYDGSDFVISNQTAPAGNFVTGADAGGAITWAPDNVNDADSNPINELQNLSSTASGTNRTINISSGTGTTISVADNDNSSTNEIQALSISGSTVSLSNGGGSVVVPSSADNLGNHSATTNLDMNGNAINEALEINSSSDHVEFMRNRIDDNTT